MGKVVKPVEWTTRATNDLEKVTKFNVKLYGSKKALEISTDLLKSTEILENSDVDLTECGSIDTAFSHLKYEYRKLINNQIVLISNYSHHSSCYELSLGVNVHSCFHFPNKLPVFD